MDNVCKLIYESTKKTSGANKKDKNKNRKNVKTKILKIKHIDSVRFMLSSLSSLDNSLTGGLDKDKYMQQSDLAYMAVTNNSLMFKYVNCNKEYKKQL